MFWDQEASDKAAEKHEKLSNVTYVYEFEGKAVSFYKLPSYGIKKGIEASAQHTAFATRVWVIEPGKPARYKKNRYTGIMTTVDERELTLVLLQAVVL